MTSPNDLLAGEQMVSFRCNLFLEIIGGGGVIVSTGACKTLGTPVTFARQVSSLEEA